MGDKSMDAERYIPVANALGFPDEAAALLRGDLKIPSEVADVPFYSYGFPPALIPLWSSSAGPYYFGYWWHFRSPRATTIVRLSVEGRYRALEYARTMSQLMAMVVLEKIVADEGVQADLLGFAARVEVDDVAGLEVIAIESGDAMSGLLRRPEFQMDSPVACFEDPKRYSGDFPTEFNVAGSAGLSRFAGLEGEKSVADRIAVLPAAPAWFRATRQESVFDECLRAGDYSGAWMSLNSPGWRFGEAGIALSELAQRTGDSVLKSLADAWIANNPSRYGGY